MRFAPVALLLLAACTRLDVESEPLAAHQSSALIGGALDHDNPWLVAVCAGAATATCAACSGSLVAPNLVLTARHCIESSSGDPFAQCGTQFNGTRKQARVSTAATTLSGSPAFRDVIKVFSPTDTSHCNADIALLMLGENIPAAEAEPIAVDVGRDLASTPPVSVTTLGRGWLSTLRNPGDTILDYDDGEGYRRIRQNVPFVCAGGSAGCQVEDFYTKPSNVFVLPPAQVQIGPSSQHGDSGGAMLDQARFAAGHKELIGVLLSETVGRAEGGYATNGAQAMRLDLHRALIVNAAKEAAAAGGYPVPTWAGDADASAPASSADAGSLEDDTPAPAGGSAAPAASDPSPSRSGCVVGATPPHGASFMLALALVAARAARRRRR